MRPHGLSFLLVDRPRKEEPGLWGRAALSLSESHYPDYPAEHTEHNHHLHHQPGAGRLVPAARHCRWSLVWAVPSATAPCWRWAKAALGMTRGTILRHRPVGMCWCPCLGSTLPAFKPILLQSKCLLWDRLMQQPFKAASFCFTYFLAAYSVYTQDEWLFVFPSIRPQSLLRFLL